MKLSVKQREVLEVIKAFVGLNHYPPSISELCDLVGVYSTSTIHFHLEALKAKGFITWQKHSKRTLRVLKDND